MDASLILAIVALVISGVTGYFAWSQQRRANAAADRAALAAEEVAAIEQQRHQAEIDAAAPKVSFAVEHASGDLFRLRNTGGLEATGVTVDPGNLPPLSRQIPTNHDLVPNETVQMSLRASSGGHIPGELLVTWDGQPTPVRVPMPRKP